MYAISFFNLEEHSCVITLEIYFSSEFSFARLWVNTLENIILVILSREWVLFYNFTTLYTFGLFYFIYFILFYLCYLSIFHYYYYYYYVFIYFTIVCVFPRTPSNFFSYFPDEVIFLVNRYGGVAMVFAVR